MDGIEAGYRMLDNPPPWSKACNPSRLGLVKAFGTFVSMSHHLRIRATSFSATSGEFPPLSTMLEYQARLALNCNPF